MEKLTKKEVYKELLNNYSGKNFVSNNFLFPAMYENYINNRNLYYALSDNNLVFLVKEEKFYKLYYHLSDFSFLFNIVLDKPIVMEIIYREKSNLPLELISFWEKCGFSLHLNRDMYIGQYKKLNFPEKRNEEVLVKYGSSELEIEFTKKIIEQTFDTYTGDILKFEEVKRFISNKNVLCAYVNNKLSGILQFEIKNKVVWIGHIAIAPEFRGKGVGKELIREYISENAIDENTRYHLWVLSDNLNAINLYKKFGFIYGNKSTLSLLKIN